MAVAIARGSGATLELVQVHGSLEPAFAYGPDAVPAVSMPSPPALDPRLRAERRRTYEQLHSLAERISAEWGVAATARVLDGSVVEALAAHIGERGGDLVVMTTHGGSGMDRLWVGSVADGVVRHVSVPVLLVKPSRQASGAAVPVHFRRVLIPLDGSTLAEAVIAPAVEVIAASVDAGAECILLHVIAPLAAVALAGLSGVAAGIGVAPGRADDQTAAYLDSVAERLRSRGLTVHTRVLIHVHAARAILEYAADSGTDLIAMGTHGRTGLRRLVLGSVAENVLSGAKMSVLLYRPPPE